MTTYSILDLNVIVSKLNHPIASFLIDNDDPNNLISLYIKCLSRNQYFISDRSMSLTSTGGGGNNLQHAITICKTAKIPFTFFIIIKQEHDNLLFGKTPLNQINTSNLTPLFLINNADNWRQSLQKYAYQASI